MATLERYDSFEEMKNSEPVSKEKKKSSKETPAQRGFREFGEILRKTIVHASDKKK